MNNLNHSDAAPVSFDGQKQFIEFLSRTLSSWPVGVTEMFHVNISCMKTEWEAQREATPPADRANQDTATNSVEPFDRNREQFYEYLARTMTSWPEGVTEMFHKTTTCLKEEWEAQRAGAGASKQTFQDDAPEVIVMVVEEFRFEYRHPQSGERHTVTLTKAEAASEVEEELFQKLSNQVCSCESIGETNVVDCNCSDYIDEFVLQATASDSSMPKAGVVPQTEAWLIQDEDGHRSATARWDVAKHVPLPVTALIDRDHFVQLQGELLKINEQRLRAVTAANDKQLEIDQLKSRLAKLEALQTTPVGEVVLFGTDLKEIAWAKGRLPDVGEKLYLAQPGIPF